MEHSFLCQKNGSICFLWKIPPIQRYSHPSDLLPCKSFRIEQYKDTFKLKTQKSAMLHLSLAKPFWILKTCRSSRHPDHF
uniref:Uncharacterized protein n=1 Tax=Arundo donax TaxID=35708 RepID=A0A0A9GP84_ARUDO